MSGRSKLIPGRVVVWLICMTVIAALMGCTPKLPPSMSAEDLQTCDDYAWKDEALVDNYDTLIGTHPYLALSGDVDLWSPLNGSILPYGEPVVIKFDQPPATPGVLFRNYRVIVTSLTRTNLEYVGDQYAVVGMSSFSLQVTWTPPGSGKYIINVFLRNLETLDWLLDNPANYSEELSNTLGTYLHYGPFSAAHVCVQIDVPKAGDIVPQQPGTVVPMKNVTITVPTATRTATHRPTVTKTPTFIPSPTSTFTLKPPTRIPDTPIPDTPIPPTAVVSCSIYTDERSCWANDACKWEQPPTGGPGVCVNK